MKKFLILMAGIAMTNLLIIPQSFAEDKPLTAAAVSDPNQKTFASKCAMCHGKDGKGNPAMAKSFKVEVSALDLTNKAVSEKSDADLNSMISNGKNKMPAYGKQLKPDAITGLVSYIRSLAPKKSQP